MKFYVIGLNYQKADAKLRGIFSVSEAAQQRILSEAKELNISSISIVSTCNRTEIYGRVENPYLLIKLLCRHTKGTLEEFEKVSYVYREQEAIDHLFRVGAGLDSQILGDFEIIGQLRNSFRRSKDAGVLDSYMERLVNSVIQASRRIKNETKLSSGITSVSFASVKYIMEQVPDYENKKILLFGTGKIGRNTVGNLVKHIPRDQITLINRTRKNSESIGEKYNLAVKNYIDLIPEIAQSDILIVATGAAVPTISKFSLVRLQKPLLIIDLSVPQNVDENVDEVQGVDRIHLDELSQVTEQMRTQRAEEIPIAIKLLEEAKQEFFDWLSIRRFAPAIRAFKEKLDYIKECEIDYQSKKLENFNFEQAEIIGDRIIQKITSQLANYLREEEDVRDEYLDKITRVFQLEFNNDVVR